MSELTLKVERDIAATPEKVFNAWLNPEALAKFMVPGEGMTVPRAQSDGIKGGKFEIVMAAGEQEIPHHGEYLEVDPHSKLVFTWESPFSMAGSTVTLTLSPSEKGTRLVLEHIRFVDEESRNNHEGGWTAILEQLENWLN